MTEGMEVHAWALHLHINMHSSTTFGGWLVCLSLAASRARGRLLGGHTTAYDRRLEVEELDTAMTD
jgi:hypothetical protein